MIVRDAAGASPQRLQTSTDVAAPSPILIRIAGWMGCVGLLAGAVTLLVNDALPGSWAQAGNSFADWCLLSYGAGRLLATRSAGTASALWAAAAGALTLVCLDVGYYGLLVAEGRADQWARVLFWFLAALPAGAAFGVTGWAWRSRSPWPGAIGAAIVGALFAAEVHDTLLAPLRAALSPAPPGVEYALPTVSETVVAWLWAALGLLVTVLTAGPGRRRVLAVVLFLPVLAVLVAALDVALSVFSRIA